MKKPFEAGDRIATYSAFGKLSTVIERIDSEGRIVTTNGVCYHPKQCRRLIKKKISRRKIWMCENQIKYWDKPPVSNEDAIIEFLEVKPKK